MDEEAAKQEFAERLFGVDESNIIMRDDAEWRGFWDALEFYYEYKNEG